MDKQTDIIFAFDLDGTIARYGEAVEYDVAEELNKLGHIHIITGSPVDIAKKATLDITDKTIHGMRSFVGNKSIDVSKLMNVTKDHFLRSTPCQDLRKRMCLCLRELFHSEIYVGGRSTIDIMPVKNKGHIIKKLQQDGKKVVYFYDNVWGMNAEIHNDTPAIEVAWKSIKTCYQTFKKDLRECLKTLS